MLIGLMATGKTTVGRALAEALDLPYVDNDDAFVARTGHTPAEHARLHGEDAMHTVEAEVLRDHLGRGDEAVLAAPASVADLEGVDLGEAFVVWLDADPEVLTRRVQGGDHRPLLDTDVATVLARMAEERHDRYAALADLRVDTGVTPPDDAVRRILAALDA